MFFPLEEEKGIAYLCFVFYNIYFVFVFEEATASRRRGSLSPLGGMPLRRTQVANTDGQTPHTALISCLTMWSTWKEALFSFIIFVLFI